MSSRDNNRAKTAQRPKRSGLRNRNNGRVQKTDMSSSIVKREQNSGKVSYVSGTKSRGNIFDGAPLNAVRIKKEEFLYEVLPTENWAVTKLAINPGVAATFPWLSGVAKNFEKYKIHSFTIKYKTGQSSIIPGKVQFAPDFDATDPAPTSKREALTYTFATDGPIWQNFSLSIPSGYLMNQEKYYIRVDDEIVDNLKFYDPANIWIGNDAVSTELAYLGEIWVEYDITLFEPQTPRIVSFSSLSKKFIFTDNVNNMQPLGLSITSQVGNLPILCDPVLNIFTFGQKWKGIMIVQIRNDTLYGQMPFTTDDLLITQSTGVVYNGRLTTGGSTYGETGYNSRMYVLSYDVPLGGVINFNSTGGHYQGNNFTSLTVVFQTGEISF